jgi:hypothetical protein
LKKAKKPYGASVILLVSKLPVGKDVRAQLELKARKKSFPTLVILLISKLPTGKEVKAQL